MTRGWKTSVSKWSGEGPNESYSTSYKTYSLQEAGALIAKYRGKEAEAGLPKRKIKPVSRYVLEELIWQFLNKDAPDGATLEMIIVEDTRAHGL
jgi:hypothetical protein